MELKLSNEDIEFKDEVQSFLDAELTQELREAGRLMTSVYCDYEPMMKWHQILYKKGWVAPAWPKEYGGPGWSVVQRHIFAAECARAQTPGLSPMGLGMCGPVLIGHGSKEQKAYFLPRILSGEDFWCQGYSEPEAGSDLASLQTRAVDDGDSFLVTGQKIWTTHAHFANWMFCLVRTRSESKPQIGITFLLIDMTSPGVTVRPIIMMSGEHEQNQVFLDEVRVPKSNVVGRIDEGWSVAKYLLEFERGGSSAPGLLMRLERLRTMARLERSSDGAALYDDTDFRREVSAAAAKIAAIEVTEYRVMSALSLGDNPGPIVSSMLKVQGTEMSQRLTELAIETAAYYAAPYQPAALVPGGNSKAVGPDHVLIAMPKYLNDRAASVYSGSNEIQRNIMAKVLLGA